MSNVSIIENTSTTNKEPTQEPIGTPFDIYDILTTIVNG